LVLNEAVETHVRGFFEKRGREFTELNRQQAFVPRNSEVVFNQNGTAPGMWFSKTGKVFISMPGVPFEMKAMMTETVLPRLVKEFQPPIIFHKIIQTVGIGESFLAEKISVWENNLPEHIKLAYLPSAAMVKLRLTGFGNDRSKLEKEVLSQLYAVLPVIEKYVFGYDDDTLEDTIGKYLIKDEKTIATAESCTGGTVASTITSVPGSSGYFIGSVVAYSNDVKINELGVKSETIETYGAVSEQTAKEMAEGIRKKLNTSIGISTTGIAGPDGGTEEKPVGTVWIAYSDEKKTVAKKLQLGKLRDVNIRISVVSSLNMVREILKYE
jgi:nicotinamide-nucleotide amidase